MYMGNAQSDFESVGDAFVSASSAIVDTAETAGQGIVDTANTVKDIYIYINQVNILIINYT